MTSHHRGYLFQVINKERGCYCSAALASYIVSDADVLLSNMRLTLTIVSPTVDVCQ